MAKKSNKNGRPSKYVSKYCKEVITFFDIEPHTVSSKVTTYKNGTTIEEEVEIANDLPTLASFASKIGIHRDTLNQWTKNHKEFSDAIKKAKELQEKILVTNGLKGLYNPAFAIFTAKNIIGWKDRQDITSDDSKLTGPYIYIPKKE
jgi:hypothetical protein